MPWPRIEASRLWFDPTPVFDLKYHIAGTDEQRVPIDQRLHGLIKFRRVGRGGFVEVANLAHGLERNGTSAAFSVIPLFQGFDLLARKMPRAGSDFMDYSVARVDVHEDLMSQRRECPNRTCH